MKCNPIPERQDWFICSRKPTICPLCKTKEVRPSMFVMPKAESAHPGKWHFAGCQPHMQIYRAWGCCKCDAAFFKDTDKNIAVLVCLAPHQWALLERIEKDKAKLMWK